MYRISSTEPSDSHRPAWLASFSGADEKPVSASNAKRIILLQRIFGLSGEPLLPVVGERHLAEADPRDHAADEARLLRHGEQRIERAAAHQPEVAGVERDVDLGRARQQPVEAVRRCALERSLAGAALAHAIDDVGVLLAHRLEHRRQQLGRVLQVRVDDQDRVAAAKVETGGQRQLVTVIARQVDRDDVRIARPPCAASIGQLPSREPSLTSTSS